MLECEKCLLGVLFIWTGTTLVPSKVTKLVCDEFERRLSK